MLKMPNHAKGRRNRRTTRPGSQWLAGLAWVAVCLAGIYLAMHYEFTPGRLGPRQAAWPPALEAGGSTALASPPTQTTVLAFLHPRCVCTRATVTQLVKVLESHPDAALIVPFFTPPEGSSDKAWEDSAYVRTIQAAIPSATIVADRGGVQARRFGALTSGTILVYDGHGREMFRGGITDRRGGERDNPGLQRFARFVAGESLAEANATPVFGCPLVGPEEVGGEEDE